jgi:site-specific recombinase XerD
VPLAKITFEGLSQWVALLSAGDLGPSGIRQSVFVLSAALDHAVRSGRIRANPARGLGLPRVQRRDYIFLTNDQLHELAAATGPWRVFVLLLGYTGLRWGEATALRVRDIDLGRRRIDVRRAFADAGGHIVVGTPKSHQSRTVPIELTRVSCASPSVGRKMARCRAGTTRAPGPRRSGCPRACWRLSDGVGGDHGCLGPAGDERGDAAQVDPPGGG